MSFGDDHEPFDSTLLGELGPYPDPPTPEAVRVYVTRRADLACAKARETGDDFDARTADFWIDRIEPAVADAEALARANARLEAARARRASP